MVDTKKEMIEKMANNGSYSSDQLYSAYDRYINTFIKPIPRKRKKEETDEKDRNSRNKKKR